MDFFATKGTVLYKRFCVGSPSSKGVFLFVPYLFAPVLIKETECAIRAPDEELVLQVLDGLFITALFVLVAHSVSLLITVCSDSRCVLYLCALTTLDAVCILHARARGHSSAARAISTSVLFRGSKSLSSSCAIFQRGSEKGTG